MSHVRFRHYFRFHKIRRGPERTRSEPERARRQVRRSPPFLGLRQSPFGHRCPPRALRSPLGLRKVGVVRGATTCPRRISGGPARTHPIYYDGPARTPLGLLGRTPRRVRSDSDRTRLGVRLGVRPRSPSGSVVVNWVGPSGSAGDTPRTRRSSANYSDFSLPERTPTGPRPGPRRTLVSEQTLPEPEK